MAWAVMMINVTEKTSFQTATGMNCQVLMHLVMLTTAMGQVTQAFTTAHPMFHFLKRSPSRGRHGINGVRPWERQKTMRYVRTWLVKPRPPYGKA